MAMNEVLEEMSIEQGGDYVSRFDLIAGTSVGGVGALISSQCNST